MFGEVFRLEWRQQVRSPAFVLAAIALGAYSLWGLQDIAALLARPGVAYNAPALVAQLIALLGLAGIVFIPLYVTAAVLRDIECRSEEIILSTRVTRIAYVGGRTLAAYAIGMFVVLLCASGAVLGQYMPWIDQTRIGPTPWHAMLWSALVLVAPNTLLVTVFVSFAASRTRSLRATYVALIVFELIRFAAGQLLAGSVAHGVAAMFDPYGVRELLDGVLHASVEELNRGLPSMSSAFVGNRILWLTVSAMLFMLTCLGFRPHTYTSTAVRSRNIRNESSGNRSDTGPLPRVLQRFTASTWVRQVWSLYRGEAAATAQGAPFAITVSACIVAVLFSLIALGHGVDGPVLPSGAIVFDAVHQGLHWVIYATIAFHAGELVWRDRACGFAEASDAYPVAAGTRFAAASLVLLMMVVTLQGVGGVTGYVWHAAHGLASLHGSGYARALVMDSVPYAFFGILALCLQLLANHRYLGYALCASWLLFTEVWLARMGWNFPAWVFGHLPTPTYSDLSGAWPSAKAALAYMGYWLIGGAALVALTLATVARSGHVNLRDRIRDARTRLSGPHGAFSAIALAVFVFMGVLIQTSDHEGGEGFSSSQAAAYERKYAAYAAKPQLRIVAISLAADLSKADGWLRVHAHYQLANHGSAPVDEVAVQFPPGFIVRNVSLPAHRDVLNDGDLRFVVYRLERPVRPGEKVDFDATLTHRDPPLADSYQEVWLTSGRPFIGASLLPRIGYQPDLALLDADERARQGLPVRDSTVLPMVANNLASSDSDWIAYEATLSTDDSQLALTSGRRVESWRSAGRTYFRYVADVPMLNMPPLIFGDYATKSYKQDGTSITVFYDPEHAWNVDRLLKAAQDALATFGRYYAHYPRANLNLVEATAGIPPQSFPGLVVLPEDHIFSAAPAGAAGIDSAYLIVTHEIAHQWWGHQVISAATPGADLLTESLAEYSALRLYGETHPRNGENALLDELQRRYLIGHATNTRKEVPLIHVTEQPYVAYDKGPLALHALEAESCKSLPQSLREFFIAYRFAPAPYPTAENLLAEIATNCDRGASELIDEWFRAVVLYDARLESPRATRMLDGRYRVTFSIRASRFTVDGTGRESVGRAVLPPEVAIYGKPGVSGIRKLVYQGAPEAEPGSRRYEVLVDERPYRIQLDPRHLWLNRASEGTEVSVVSNN